MKKLLAFNFFFLSLFVSTYASDYFSDPITLYVNNNLNSGMDVHIRKMNCIEGGHIHQMPAHTTGRRVGYTSLFGGAFGGCKNDSIAEVYVYAYGARLYT